MPNYEDFNYLFRVINGNGSGNGTTSTGYGAYFAVDGPVGAPDGSTDVGSGLLYRQGTYSAPTAGATPGTLLGTTPNGVYISAGGGFYFLLTNTNYSIGTSLGALNTTDPYTYCFLAGTRIATPKGEVPVEYLEIGDQILTAEGRSVPVKWLGEQRIKNWMFTSHAKAPVCISAGALGEGLPHSDLYVSADHGMILDDLVIDACALVNNDTIRFVPMAEMPEEFTYYHIETEAHVVVLANGAASETFIDAVGRKAFDNYQQYLDLYGVDKIVPEMDRLRISSARLLPETVKAKLGEASPDWIVALDNPDTKLTLKRGAAQSAQPK